MFLKTLAVVIFFERDGMFSWALSAEIISAPLEHIFLNVRDFYVSREGWFMRYIPEDLVLYTGTERTVLYNFY